MEFGRADLGLLLSLDALLAEASVSRAAHRLGLSQPALSAQLARLRELVGDPLLVPSGRGMLPTPRAEALRAPLHEALEQLQAVVRTPRAFDPAMSGRTFRVAASDFIFRTLPLAAAVARKAPGVRLALLALDPRQAWQQLETGEVDLLVASERLTPKQAQGRRLFQEQLVLVQRPGHPRGSSPLTLAQFCALDHVLVSPEGGGFHGATDTALAALGLQRRVVASLPSFLLVPPLVLQTDLVSLVPRRLAAAFAGQLDSAEPPLALPGFNVMASWHKRMQHDPAHAWLREMLVQAAAPRG
jgi:DNA-binding transcriptional LysR family regulator